MYNTREVWLELRHLRYFIAVAREQNFTRAAAKLHVAQPPLSRQIQQLEQELGAPLIERGSRPVHLTEIGRLVFEQAVQVIERIDGMAAMVRGLRAAELSHFGIGFVASTLYGHLPAVIRRYRAARPGVDLTLLEMTTLEQIAALKEGRIDVGFGRIPFEDPMVKRQLLRREKIIVALPANSPKLRQGGPFRLADLAGETLIIYPRAPRPSYADQVLALYRERGLAPGVVHEVRELQTALGLVAAEIGICLVPASVERLRRDSVAYRPLDDPMATSPIIMTFRWDDKSPEIDRILDLVRDIYREEKIDFGT